MNISRAIVVGFARGLLSPDDDNTEYDRAISELVCEIFGAQMDNKGLVLSILRFRVLDDSAAAAAITRTCKS